MRDTSRLDDIASIHLHISKNIFRSTRKKSWQFLRSFVLYFSFISLLINVGSALDSVNDAVIVSIDEEEEEEEERSTHSFSSGILTYLMSKGNIRPICLATM